MGFEIQLIEVAGFPGGAGIAFRALWWNPHQVTGYPVLKGMRRLVTYRSRLVSCLPNNLCILNVKMKFLEGKHDESTSFAQGNE